MKLGAKISEPDLLWLPRCSNGHGFLLSDGNGLKLGTHMNIHASENAII